MWLLDDQAEKGLELPSSIVTDGGDGPGKLLTESLREESLDGDVELVGEDNTESWIDVVLPEISTWQPA